MQKPELKISIFADGADKESISKWYKSGWVKGFTTNPTLMAKAGVRDYRGFSRDVLSVVRDLPVSFEIFADDFEAMEKQALEIATWGSNVNVKVPITNTKGELSLKTIRRLCDQGVKLNITAIFTEGQLHGLKETLKPSDDVIISIFAGRIADTGRDPIPMMAKAVKDFSSYSHAKILWASPREVLNLYQANACGCHIITMTDDLLNRVKFFMKPLEDFSLDTVKMFYNDAKSSGLSI